MARGWRRSPPSPPARRLASSPARSPIVGDARGSRLGAWGFSGLCALGAGLLFHRPALLTAICVVWGFAVVADSAQFSAAVSELVDARYVGTALTVQTCLGFLLTVVSIRLVPALLDRWGWERVFAALAVGPLLGIWSLWRLRGLPAAARLAGGRG